VLIVIAKDLVSLLVQVGLVLVPVSEAPQIKIREGLQDVASEGLHLAEHSVEPIDEKDAVHTYDG
jgi:hypothetical protein